MLKKLFEKLRYFICTHKMPVFIFVVAWVIRLIGIDYGLPQILNIDEPSFVRTVIGLNNNLDPHRFDWPHAHFYLNFLFYGAVFVIVTVLETFNLQTFVSSFFPLLFEDSAIYYFVSRFINATLGALTVIPVYFISNLLLRSRKLALTSAVIFTFFPLHVFDSHLALLDTAMTFWLSWFIYFSIKIINSPSKKNFILSGIFMGLAFGTKYHALLYYLFFAICIFYAVQPKFSISFDNYLIYFKKFIRKLFSKNFLLNYLYNLFAFFTTYLITNPTFITNNELFWSDTYGRGFLFQFQNVGNKTLYEYPFSLYENLVTQAVGDYGLTLYLVIITLFILYLFFNYRNKVTNLTILFPLLFYFYVSQKERSPSHYFIFLLPLLSVAITNFIYDLSKFKSVVSSFVFGKRLRLSKNLIFMMILAIVLVSPVLKSLEISYRFSSKDTRVMLLSWLQRNVSSNDPIYIYGETLPLIDYGVLNVERIRLMDYDEIRDEDEGSDLYIVVGHEDVELSDILNERADTESIEGGEQDMLEDGELVYYVPKRDYRFGPPIYVFKIKNENID